MSAIHNNIDIWQIFISTRCGVMVDITPSSLRPCAKKLKMASHEPIMQSIIDWFGETDDWLM